jgi:hypothetical protein
MLLCYDALSVAHSSILLCRPEALTEIARAHALVDILEFVRLCSLRILLISSLTCAYAYMHTGGGEQGRRRRHYIMHVS